VSGPIVGEAPRFPYVVALGASAGGLEPLLTIIGSLPGDLDAAVLVVVHVPSSGPSALPKIVRRRSAMPARHATDGDEIVAGDILIAPPDHHMTIDGTKVVVRRGPLINRTRPAIDPLFQSVALHAGARGIGVVLSGALDDGAAGLAAISAAGGIAIVQDPSDAMHPSMPRAALEIATVAYRLPASGIAEVIRTLTNRPPDEVAERPDRPGQLEKELLMSELDLRPVTTEDLGTSASVFGCPACGGTLWQLGKGDGFRFRCRVGHAYSPMSLLEAQGANAEDGLWIAYRALDEQASLARRLAEQAQTNGQDAATKRFLGQARTAERHAEAIKQLLRLEPGTDGVPADEDERTIDEAQPTRAVG
jgi:two-component system chemotaxis response regulator CheB